MPKAGTTCAGPVYSRSSKGVPEEAWQTHVTVAAVCEQEGRFLLVEELIDGQLRLNQPAGHLDKGESLTAAVVRETREEAAWDILPVAVIGVYLWQEPTGTRTFLRAAFSAQCLKHHPDQPLDTGVQRALWLSHAEIAARPERLRSPLVLRCIEDYLKGHSYPLDLMHHLSN